MRKIEFLVLHYTASTDVGRSTINAWHVARDFAEVGYHYIIRKNGKVEIGRALSKIGAHTRGFNKNSIGIVLTGADNLKWYPSNKQIKAAQKLIAELRSTYG
ncbi:hypothetical protein LCGC14_2764610, partial [marine sediment metagenome]